MKAEFLAEAVSILTQHHSTTVTFNQVKNGDVVSNAEQLVIHNCCHSVIAKLITAGFKLHASEKGISVDKV